MKENKTRTSTQVKPSPRVDSIKKFLPQNMGSRVAWELQQIHTGTGAGQSVLIVTGVTDAEARIQVTEPEQWRAWSRSHEFQHLLALFVRQLLHDLPEKLNSGMFLVIVANRVYTTVERVASQVSDIDLTSITTDKCL